MEYGAAVGSATVLSHARQLPVPLHRVPLLLHLPLAQAARSRWFPLLSSQALILRSARDFFDGATRASDEALSHAEACLQILPLPLSDAGARTKEAMWRAELDLVDGVRRLGGMGVDVLPLEVRLTRPVAKRLVYVKKMLEASSLPLALSGSGTRSRRGSEDAAAEGGGEAFKQVDTVLSIAALLGCKTHALQCEVRGLLLF